MAAFTVLCELAATYARAVVALYAQRELLANPKTGCVHKNPLIAVVGRAGICCGFCGSSR